jgi:hypothetical protein
MDRFVYFVCQSEDYGRVSLCSYFTVFGSLFRSIGDAFQKIEGV